MEDRTILEGQLNKLEKRVIKALILIQRGFVVIRTNPEIRGWKYFKDICQSLTGKTKGITLMMLRCFQQSTGRCMFCDRFSSYQEKVVGVLYVLETLILQLNSEFLDHFPLLSAGIARRAELHGLQEIADALYERRLQIADGYTTSR